MTIDRCLGFSKGFIPREANSYDFLNFLKYRNKDRNSKYRAAFLKYYYYYYYLSLN